MLPTMTKSLPILATALVAATGALADFNLWTVHDVTQDCESVPTCRDIYGPSWVVAGPSSGSDISGTHSCPDTIGESKGGSGKDGKDLVGTKGLDYISFGKDICGVGEPWTCSKGSDGKLGCKSQSGKHVMSCDENSQTASCSAGFAETYYLNAGFSCKGDITCKV